ncbi:hypothetical protein AAHA92_30812 [Salvia divinorum]|uniref:Uncharacterized protein n=1 Tax=Salvia divinorum TaxID=28513 RepID=A0ABD1FS30_SALDI
MLGIDITLIRDKLVWEVSRHVVAEVEGQITKSTQSRHCNIINTYATDFDHKRNNRRMQIVNQDKKQRFEMKKMQ